MANYVNVYINNYRYRDDLNISCWKPHLFIFIVVKDAINLILTKHFIWNCIKIHNCTFLFWHDHFTWKTLQATEQAFYRLFHANTARALSRLCEMYSSASACVRRTALSDHYNTHERLSNHQNSLSNTQTAWRKHESVICNSSHGIARSLLRNSCAFTEALHVRILMGVFLSYEGIKRIFEW